MAETGETCTHGARWVYTDDDLHGPGTCWCVMCELEAARVRIVALEAERDLWKGALLEGYEEVKRASGQLEAYKHKFQDRLRKAEGQSE